jgi:hypothetical protein
MRSACASSIAARKGSSHPRGRALLHCAAAIFDDLRQGVRNIEFLRDPTSDEIKVGPMKPSSLDSGEERNRFGWSDGRSLADWSLL